MSATPSHTSCSSSAERSRPVVPGLPAGIFRAEALPVRLSRKRFFASCRLGTGFNLLKNVHDPDGILINYNPKEILDYCRHLSPKVVLREGYAEDDFTIFLYK